MTYIFLILLLLGATLLYFRIADRFNIIDQPNHRSSHTAITIRGGGILFYIAALFYFAWCGFTYPYFFIGLTCISLISFLDDVYTLSNKLRILIHLLAVMLMLFQLNLFQESWYMILAFLIIIIGIINAYNFMDGINGITAAYSLVVLFLLWLANKQYNFIDNRLLYSVALSDLIFAFFNFRNKAKCFAGDVGSVSMAFLLIFLLLSLILYTQNLLYILFLAVYGTDAGLTIMHRLLKKENIFEAHRSHLYQYLSNEAGINKLAVAAVYALLQLGIGLGVLYISKRKENVVQVLFVITTIGLLCLVYTLLKTYIQKKYMRLR